MSLSNIMRKTAGLLFEIPSRPRSEGEIELEAENETENQAEGDPSAPVGDAMSPKTIEQIVREAKGPNLDEVAVDATQIPANLGAPGGILKGDTIDFAAIYRAAKLEEPTFGAEAMLETLNSLPAELPLVTRRATVRAMLATLGKTTGATPESVVADASRKLAALQSFETYMAKKTADAVALSEKEIAQLEKQIDSQRETMQKAKSELLKVSTGCEAESNRIDDVLEFFSLDAAPSKLAPPIHAPQTGATQPNAAQTGVAQTGAPQTSHTLPATAPSTRNSAG